MSSKVKLSELVNIRLGQTFRSKAESKNPTDVKLVQIRDVQGSVIRSIDHLAYANISSNAPTIQIQENDILFPLRGSRFEAALYRVEHAKLRVTAPNQIAIIQVTSPQITPEYLLWFLNSSVCRHALKSMSKGSTVQSISRKALDSLEVDVPSVHKQGTIMAIAQNWVAQQGVYQHLLENGNKMADRLCLDVLNSQGDL